MIGTFKDKDTEKIWNQNYSKRLPNDIQRIGYRKLIILHRSRNINDLRIPLGNRLEQLSGDRKGQYSIRINDQWRICFYWNDGIATEVELTDYH
ncbi:MAG: type II toxin-antitoxin system RelE/ParE family toxin [Spirochaetales bacterium]|nr:type II toxin-antitoxin system RelE/ParE family toxin [Spirochaetales bacterium]